VGGQLVEFALRVDRRERPEGGPAAGGAEGIHEVAPESGVVEDSVEIGAPDASARSLGAVELGDGAASPLGDAEQRRLRGPLGAAHVDLVAAHLGAAGQVDARDLRGDLVFAEDRHRRQQAEPLLGVRRRLDVLRVPDQRAQHLEAAADADDRRPSLQAAGHVGSEARVLQPTEVGDRALGSRQDEGVGHAVVRPFEVAEADVRLRLEGVEVGEVGHPRVQHHVDADLARRRSSADLPRRDGVLFGQADVAEVRHDAEHRPRGLALEELQAGLQDPEVAAELVDDEAAHARPLGFEEQVHRADDLGEDAAHVDVRGEQHGSIGDFRGAHVDDVGVAEVDLGGAAGAFDDDDVVVALEAGEAAPDEAEQGRFVVLVLGRGHGLHGPAHHDNLGGGIGGRLEQHRVHVHGRLEAAGAGLDRGGAADLAAVEADVRIVGHVLRLERSDAESVLAQDAAEGGHEGGLAHPTGGALDHDGRHKRKKGAASPRREAAPSSLRFPADGRLFSGVPSIFAQAGLLAPGSRSRVFPPALRRGSDVGRTAPVTAAGPPPNHTGFPIKPSSGACAPRMISGVGRVSILFERRRFFETRGAVPTS
jgi:hypothetical protein